jgi:1-acyl-sn-glycerol-3-phosphate acyltransferase
VQPFKKGAFVFARETGLPVLPVTIKHSREVLPPDSLNLIPGPVEIIVHRPVYVPPGDAGRLEDTIEAVRTTIAGPLNG